MSGANEREDLVMQIMSRILTRKPVSELGDYDPLKEIRGMARQTTRERIERREREAQGDPLPPRSIGGEHG